MKNKKLSLNKTTVANLNDEEMKKLWGGESQQCATVSGAASECVSCNTSMVCTQQ